MVDPTPTQLFKDCQILVNIVIVGICLGLGTTEAPSSEFGGVIKNGLGSEISSSRFLFRDCSDDVDGAGEEGAGDGWLDTEQVRQGVAAADAIRKWKPGCQCRLNTLFATIEHRGGFPWGWFIGYFCQAYCDSW